MDRLAARMLRRDPADENAMIARLRACGELGRDRAAQRCADRFAEAAPDAFDAQYRAGSRLLGISQPSLAVRHLARAVELDETSSRAWTDLSAALLWVGEWEWALDAAETAVHIDPEDPLGWCNVGDARRALGDMAGAVAAFERAAASDRGRVTKARSRLRDARRALRGAGG